MQWTDDSFNYFFFPPPCMLKTVTVVFWYQPVLWHDYVNQCFWLAFLDVLILSFGVVFVFLFVFFLFMLFVHVCNLSLCALQRLWVAVWVALYDPQIGKTRFRFIHAGFQAQHMQQNYSPKALLSFPRMQSFADFRHKNKTPDMVDMIRKKIKITET